VLSQDPCEKSPTTKKIKQSSNFRDEEDVCLVEARINVEMDPMCGNEQKTKAYWKRILENYNENKQFVTECISSFLMLCWSTT
jgi:hypothetical protein